MKDIYADIAFASMEDELEKIASKEGIILGNLLEALGLKRVGRATAKASANYLSGARKAKKQIVQRGKGKFRTPEQKYLVDPAVDALGMGTDIAADPVVGGIGFGILPGPATALIGPMYLKPRAAAARQVARMQGKTPAQVKAIGEWAQRSSAYPSTILGYGVPYADLYAEKVLQPTRRFFGKGGDLRYALGTPARMVQDFRRKVLGRRPKK